MNHELELLQQLKWTINHVNYEKKSKLQNKIKNKKLGNQNELN